jgi:4-amino-4-deoxy-L-arabinose transferase-like glycosyltransferase
VRLLFVFLLGVFSFLHLHRMGTVSPTWDEGGDAAIVDCIQKTGNPFACLADISQTRLPFFIHAFAGPAFGAERPHYLVSFVFSLATFLLVYFYARWRFGTAIATLAAALMATSPQWLASGRMVLTHSSVIFAFFTTAAFLAAFEFAEGGAPHPALRATLSPPGGERGLGMVLVCAIAAGLAAASSPLGVLNGLVILAVYRRFAWRDLLFFPVGAIAFFAGSVIYVKPENFRALVIACTLGERFPFWNFFETGSPDAPWWFPFVVLFAKVGPWWLLLAAVCAFRAKLERPLVAFVIAFFVNLLIKGAVFHYETPHHQVQFYPVLFLVMATLIVRAWRPWVGAAVAIAFAIQTWDVVRFFPNYLFYGSQYGDRFIGEFYGPAVMHAQDKDAVVAVVDRILSTDPRARILVADHNALESNNPRVVPFSKRDPGATYEYAFVDRLYARHFRMPGRDEFNAHLGAHYVPYFEHTFPPNVWMYRVMRLR